jgi:hypothetical protein
VTESNLPTLVPYLPPDGFVFFTASECPLADVSADLCRIVSFLQSNAASSKLERFHDWWEHDALHFPDGESDYRGLFQCVDTPRSLIESMTGDHRVFIAFSSTDRNWYLRFFADWDDAHIVGEYSIALSEQRAASFAAEVIPKLRCLTASEDVLVYFRRIEA